MDKKFPTGIRPRGNGLEIKIWQHSKPVHQEIIECNPDNAADVRRVKKYRDFIAWPKSILRLIRVSTPQS